MKALHICDDCKVQTVAPICQAHGCGIEIQSFYEPNYLTNANRYFELHSEAIRNIPSRSMHGPFADLVPGSLDPLVAKLAEMRFHQALEVGRALEISHLVLHHGYMPGAGTPKNWLERSTPFWNNFLTYCPENIHIHLENVFERGPELLSDLVAAIADPRIDICLDIGHTQCFSKTAPLKWIERLGSQIGYVHLHNNHGDGDDHLGLDDGIIPMVEVCHALNDSAPGAIWALEVKLKFMTSTLEWLEHQALI